MFTGVRESIPILGNGLWRREDNFYYTQMGYSEKKIPMKMAFLGSKISIFSQKSFRGGTIRPVLVLSSGGGYFFRSRSRKGLEFGLSPPPPPTNRLFMYENISLSCDNVRVRRSEVNLHQAVRRHIPNLRKTLFSKY